ncbi:unnamed protein product [Pelagomonas calceolata]|uniref:Uncharacterized protein n=1 Tax=Pelagomonas calceolata TaxID=35677 RepID=A0A8J2T1L1_9STRA|nr:unnamed protein product [Pelagomonas calceolata]
MLQRASRAPVMQVPALAPRDTYGTCCFNLKFQVFPVGC